MREITTRSLLAAACVLAFCLTPQAMGAPLKVFILAGQSNMQGHVHIRTWDALGLSPETAPLLEEMRGADGSPLVCDQVWISCLGCSDQEQVGRLTMGFGASPGGPKMGPELMFGITMQKLLGEPILIIKTAWGGKSLHTDFRPRGAGPNPFSEAQLRDIEARGQDLEAMKAERAQATGHTYRLMIDHVRHVLSDIGRIVPDHDPAEGYELSGFVWFQGWNDMVDQGAYPDRAKPGGYDRYSELLAQLIRDVRSDLSAPDLPFVIGVMGVGGPIELYGPQEQRHAGVHRNFRMAMAAPAAALEFRGNVALVRTEDRWDLEVVALRDRERSLAKEKERIASRQKEGELGPEEAAAAIEELYTRAFTRRELALLRESTSNQDYHYMGSARIIAPIGRDFAVAMNELLKVRRERKR